MHYFSIKSMLQLFYFSTQVPVRLYIQHRLHWQLPHDLKSINEHLSLSTVRDYPHMQTFNNEWDEQFWSFKQENLTIVLGPIFLTKLPGREKLRKKANYHGISMQKFNKTYTQLESNARIIREKQFTYSRILLQAMIETMSYEPIIEQENPFALEFKKEFAEQLANETIESTYVLEKQLVEDIKNDYLEDAVITLEEIIEQMSTKDAIIQQNNLLSLCSLITRAFIDIGFNANLSFSLSNNWMNTIKNNFEVTQVHATAIAMFRSFQQLFSERNYVHLHPSIGRALFYIDGHLTDKMTVEAIADYAHVHPNHLSNLFRSELQSTVVETINHKKVESSCHLLCHSEQSIIEIAMIFNFCNQGYYAKWFKKFMHMTPREYRKKYKKIYSIDHRKISNN